jgi:hypothetical protein
MDDEFYIGYERDMPPRLASQVRHIAAGLLVLSFGVPALLLVAQAPAGPGVFEYGRTREFTGVVIEEPYPLLDTGDAVYLLVAPYKFGAAGLVSGMEGAAVRMDGTLIERDGIRMVEIVPGSIVRTGDVRRQRVRPTAGGAVTVTGEIVDPKCHLGVMKPGAGQVHRDCAVHCISGGIPPMLVVPSATGEAQRLLLIGDDGGRPGAPLLQMIGRPVTLSGRQWTLGSLTLLEVTPPE